jgi:hypothetical protein
MATRNLPTFKRSDPSGSPEELGRTSTLMTARSFEVEADHLRGHPGLVEERHGSSLALDHGSW